MLQAMRKYTKSWVASLFLGLLALSFGVWGIADIFRGGGDDTVATVGGVKIPVTFYQQNYRNLTRQASRNGDLTPAQQKALGKNALEGVIDQTAIDNYVRRYGLTVTDETVSARIRAIPAFVGPLGTFDHTQFLRAIDSIGYDEPSFVAAIRAEISRDQLLGATASGMELPPGYAQAFFDYLNQVRAAAYVTVPASAAGNPPAPSDADLAAYMKAHEATFSTPEYRDVSFAWVSPQDVMGQIKVSDDQLKQQYEVQKAQYVIPEKRTLEQITFPDLASAKAAKAKVASGTSFEEIAKQRGLKPDDIQIGTLSKEDLAERGAAVFAVPQGGVTDPLKAPVGYALIHVVSITPGSNKSFADVKEDLRRQISQQLAQSKIGDISNAYIDESSRGESLEQAAKKVGMHAGRVAAIDAKGNTPDGAKAQIPSDPELLPQMFKAEPGEEGDPFQAKSGVTYVVKVEGVRPPKLKPLDQVRAEVTAAWQKEQMSKRLASLAKELATKASAQKSLTAVAAQVGSNVQQTGALRLPLVGRPDAGGPLPRALREQIFNVPAGEAVAGPSTDGKSYIVALVTGVRHPPAGLIRPARLKQFGARIAQEFGSDFMQVMSKAARAKEGVKINQQTVDRIAGGESS
ncbi:MAG TPA: SurA N-terminal domain-containing protein [Rhizomicrobium sp.]|nr:SurA N-terminal domain-containing protein [Rhizomicrobium sp.]